MAEGVDPIHFGIIMAVNLSIGMYTPPFGLNLFTSQAVFQAPLGMIYRGVLPFLAINFCHAAGDHLRAGDLDGAARQVNCGLASNALDVAVRHVRIALPRELHPRCFLQALPSCLMIQPDEIEPMHDRCMGDLRLTNW